MGNGKFPSREWDKNERGLFEDQPRGHDINIKEVKDLAIGKKRMSHCPEIGENAKDVLKPYGNSYEVADSIGAMLILDYLKERKDISDRQGVISQPKIVGSKLDCLESTDRFTFILTATNLCGEDDKRRFTTVYNLEFHKPEKAKFDQVYHARLGNMIFGKKGRHYKVIGSFRDQLTESPEARAKRIYDTKGIRAFLRNVLPNDCYGFYWGCDNATEGLKSGKIPIDDFLKRGAYIILPYKNKGIQNSILKRIEEGKYTQTGEFWVADFERYSGRD